MSRNTLVSRGASRSPVALSEIVRYPLTKSGAPTPAASRQRDGAHDFDWEAVTWSTTLRYLANPLIPDVDRWIDYNGTSRVTTSLGDQVNLVELDVGSSSGRIRGVSLRLYDPQSRQWSLNFANVRRGWLSAPMHGGFDASGRGLFFGQDEIDGSVVLVRFVITPETRNRVRFIQSYSADAGATWEGNWIAVDERR